MLDIYEAMPDGDWKVTKTDDKFDTVKINTDLAADKVNQRSESTNEKYNSSKKVDPEFGLGKYYYDNTTNQFTINVPKGVIKYEANKLLDPKKDTYGNWFVLTNQGFKDEDFDEFVTDTFKNVSQNSNVEYAFSDYGDFANMWTAKDPKHVTLQPMLDVMNTYGGTRRAPERVSHSHPINSYVGAEPKHYNLGSSQTDRNLVGEIAEGYKSNGYDNTVNSVYNPAFSNDFIEYNAKGDIGVENSVSNRMNLIGNVQQYEYFKNNR